MQDGRQALHELLARYERNLHLLRRKKAVYAEGEEPLSLLNQIDMEEKKIHELKQQLGQ